MKNFLFGILIGVLFAIVFAVGYVVVALLKGSHQSSNAPAIAPVATTQTISPSDQNSHIITGNTANNGAMNGDINNSFDNNVGNLSSNGISKGTNAGISINNGNFDAPIGMDETPAPTGQLSAVHGRGGMGHLRSVPRHLTNKDEYVHTNVYAPLMAMIKAAQADGIRLSIVSAYRSYDHQKRIWERKWGGADNGNTQKALEILRYSSFPGTSRHHWGTDIDFNSVSPAYWQNGEGKRIHNWLVKNAGNYGFCQTYGYGRNGGYAQEDWHWSHIPTANQYYNQINNPQVLAVATNQPIKGAAAVRKLNDHLYTYIRGISPCGNVKNRQFSASETTLSAPKTQPSGSYTLGNGNVVSGNFDNMPPANASYQDLANSLPQKPMNDSLPIVQEDKPNSTAKTSKTTKKSDTKTQTATGKFAGDNQGVALEPIVINETPRIQQQGVTICSGENCQAQ